MVHKRNIRFSIRLLEQNKAEVEGQSGDITPLEEKSEKLRSEEKKLKDSVDNIKKLSGGLTTTNEEFLVFLGKSAEENNVAVSGFTDLGTTDTDGIYRSTFDFELKGSGADINKVLEDINNIGIKCSYGSVSFRQNEKYDYLKRFFDDLSDLLILILAWNYIKLLFEAAERYVLLGVLVYTAPVAFAMGASESTANIFKSWCKMVGGQIFLLIMNAWCLRLFTSMVGTFLSNPLSI